MVEFKAQKYKFINLSINRIQVTIIFSRNSLQYW